MAGQPASKSPDPESLASAAVALEAELRRFEELAVVARRLPMASQKNLERAAGALDEALKCQERVGSRLSALTAAIAAAQRRHAATVQSLDDHAREMDKRREELTDLLGRFQAIGIDAGKLTDALRRVAASSEPAKRGIPDDEFNAIDTQIGSLATSARDLAADAADRGATEIARQADSLRQQLQSARNKLRLLQTKAEPASDGPSDGEEAPEPRRKA